MSVRISHCSTSLENYYLCIKESVSGFNNLGPQSGDLIYLVVKVDGISYCGARFVLDEPTDYKPWPDAENYVNAMTIKDVQFFKPFDISIISRVGGQYWALKYVQKAKPISDIEVVNLLNEEFTRNLKDTLYIFEGQEIPSQTQENDENLDDLTVENEVELEKVIEEIPDAKVTIMGTFQTVPFSNETDRIKGLEILVNDNFYHLFRQFPEQKTLLIPENRVFKTQGFRVEGNNVQGIRTIPDGILIEFEKVSKTPFRINLIEYECFGQRKQKEIEKSSYLNSIVIPQLMRFASAFSIITDEQTRTKTIEDWVDKIIQYISNDTAQFEKFKSWVREINPTIRESAVEREIERLLKDTFRTNLRVLLIIDELSAEQKSTIKNVVSSFKLANGENNVQFTGYVVRLVQKINMTNNESEYALTLQE